MKKNINDVVNYTIEVENSYIISGYKYDPLIGEVAFLFSLKQQQMEKSFLKLNIISKILVQIYDLAFKSQMGIYYTLVIVLLVQT